jgi:arginyl-tRNA synthetase
MHPSLSTFSYDPIKCELAEVFYKAFLRLSNNETFELHPSDFFLGLELPKDKSMGDYALPTFKFAKLLKTNPNQFANDLKDALLIENCNWILKIELKGAFLNLFTRQDDLAKILLPEMLNDHWFKKLSEHNQKQPERVMIEYSQPNTHKEFHVGHGRNVCLGDSICRLYRFLGKTVIGANYIGDEGAHIAKCLWGIKKKGGIEQIANNNNKAEWLGECYVFANNAIKDADESTRSKIQSEISAIHLEIESKKGPEFELWKETRQFCLDDYNEIYAWLGVKFDHFFYESEVSESSQSIVDEYINKGLFYEDKGAIGLDLSDEKLGFFMARKSDGTTLYITKDLALAKVKFNDFKIDRSIYVVANEQNLHFRQLFSVLIKMGFEQAKNCYHLSYGMVVRPDGKMSSRSGNSFTFLQLKNLIIVELKTYLSKYENEWDQNEIDSTAHQLAVGAIKYGMLSADPNKEIVFDPKEWVSFEGNSGPYLMYSYARTRSIINRGKAEGIEYNTDHLDLLTHETERELMRYLYEFNQTVLYSATNYRPSTLANHLFFMCKAYNRFYVEVPVLKGDDVKIKQARLALLNAFNKTLKIGLDLLGITPPERM